MNESEEQKAPRDILSGMSLLDAIARCGELDIPEDDVVRLLSDDRLLPGKFRTGLKTPGTEFYEAYQRGMAEGILNLAATLEANVSEPKAKDAYKSLSAERRRQAINRKLDELF
jgi:hypothetical protein